jgi:hypothetical protein
MSPGEVLAIVDDQFNQLRKQLDVNCSARHSFKCNWTGSRKTLLRPVKLLTSCNRSSRDSSRRASGHPLARWEDFTQTAMDPVDDCTIWYVGDVKKAASSFSTRIGSFRLPGS